jgi:YHS domain-containing protein
MSETNETVNDPVCGAQLEPMDTEHISEYGGSVFYFCSIECKRQFDANPENYGSVAA